MKMTVLALLLLTAACNNDDNLVVGSVAGGSTTPDIIFDTLGSAISGTITPRDETGAPVGDPVLAVIMSDRGNLCAKLAANRGYFRNAPEAYQALILFFPTDNACHPGQGIRLGTFIIGRECDEGASGEIVASSGPQVTTPLHALTGSEISLTEWSTTDNSIGSFSIDFDDPYGSGFVHPFYGRFKTDPCPSLDGTLLP